MKNAIRLMKIAFFISTVILLVNCAAYKPTIIENIYEGSLSDVISYDKVGILCAYYSLKSVDNLTESSQTSFKRDQELSKSVVEEQLKYLCAQKQSCYENYYLTTDKESITTDKYIDFKIHRYINWGEICIMVFPVYYTLNESICVTADVYKDNRSVKRIEEWGYIKKSGFWVFDFGESPNSIALRSYLVQKALDKSIKEL